MADTEQTQEWKSWIDRTVEREHARLVKDDQRAQALRAWASGNSLTRQDVLQVLEADDERLIDLLIDLGAALKSWWRFDDRETSAVHGVLRNHRQANRRLVAALFDLIDAVTKQGQERPESITPPAAERIENTIIHILEDLGLSVGANVQMRANIDRLTDRVQFWREHPGEAYDGHQVADALMPIITQLLEYAEVGGAE